jgi:hypothetical protein
MSRIIFKQGNYRIVEHQDTITNIEDLAGDAFNTELELDGFKQYVFYNGVFGYALERWNPSIDMGWEFVDSCFGFVGEYDEHIEEFNHYIIEEFKTFINIRSNKHENSKL